MQVTAPVLSLAVRAAAAQLPTKLLGRGVLLWKTEYFARRG
jgi:hypothetical protein